MHQLLVVLLRLRGALASGRSPSSVRRLVEDVFFFAVEQTNDFL